jgi:hypothetical protein
MMLRRVCSPLLMALALAAPSLAGAQTSSPGAPNSLETATNRYFAAVSHGDVPALAPLTSENFHLIQPDGTRLTLVPFLQQVASFALRTLEPIGNSQKITSSSVTPQGATESVDTQVWFSGVSNMNPRRGPGSELDFAKHQLTWTHSPSGAWLLEEDHVTSFLRT